MAEVTLSRSNFSSEVLESEKPVLVDFWATWCGPCMRLAPAVAAIAEERSSVLKVGKVDVSEERVLAEKYNIQSIPALLLFKNGKVVQTLIGLRPKQQIDAVLDEYL